jgi:anti-sigma28 factor (negative regulator of flagellin synthesis)
MSMRIEGQTDANVLSNVRSAETRAAGSESAADESTLAPSLKTDNVSLSSASGLAALAKTLMPADKQAKIAALTPQVRSGQYRTEASEISRSVVRKHFKN